MACTSACRHDASMSACKVDLRTSTIGCRHSLSWHETALRSCVFYFCQVMHRVSMRIWCDKSVASSLLSLPFSRRFDSVMPHAPLPRLQSQTLQPYLKAIRSTLDVSFRMVCCARVTAFVSQATLTLRNFASQVIERHNKPEVEARFASRRSSHR